MTKFSLISKTLCAASVACFISLQVFAQTPVTPTPGSPTQPPQTQPPQPEQIQPSQPVQPGQNPQTIQPGQTPAKTPRSVQPGEPQPIQPMKGDTIRPDSMGMGMTGWQMGTWVKDLNLTADQQARFKKLDEEYATKKMANPNASKAEMQQMHQDRMNAYKSVLTTDQAKKYDEMMAAKKEMKHDKKMEGGKPGKKNKTMPMDTTGNKPVPQRPKQ